MPDGNHTLDLGASLLSFTKTELWEETTNKNLLIRNFQKKNLNWSHLNYLIIGKEMSV